MNAMLHAYLELSLLMQLLVKATMVAGLALMLEAALRRAHPGLRVAVLRAGAVALVALPIVALLPSPMVFKAGPPAAQLAPLPEDPALTTAPSWYLPDPVPAAEPMPQEPDWVSVASSEPDLRLDSSPRRELAPTPAAQLPAGLVNGLLALVYTMGIGVAALRLARERRDVRSLIAEARELPECTVLSIARDFAARLTLRTAPTVVEHDDLPTPMVVGARRAVVVLPSELSAEENQAALAHELSHLKGQDVRWTLAFALLRGALWFHPLVWLLTARHRVAMEQAADFQAAQLLGNADDYARSLARVALRAAFGNPMPAGISMARRAEVTDRIERVRNWNGRVPTALLVRGTVGASLLLLLGAASARLVAEETTASGNPERVPHPVLMEAEEPESFPREAASEPMREPAPEGMELPAATEELPRKPASEPMREPAPEGKELPRTEERPRAPQVPDAPAKSSVPSAPAAPAAPDAPAAPPQEPDDSDQLTEVLSSDLEAGQQARKLAEEARQQAAEIRRSADELRKAVREDASGESHRFRERELMGKVEELKRRSADLGKSVEAKERLLASRKPLTSEEWRILVVENLGREEAEKAAEFYASQHFDSPAFGPHRGQHAVYFGKFATKEEAEAMQQLHKDQDGLLTEGVAETSGDDVIDLENATTISAAREEASRERAKFRELARQPGGVTLRVPGLTSDAAAVDFSDKAAEGLEKVVLKGEQREELIEKAIAEAVKIPACSPMDDAAREAMVRGIADKVIRQRVREALAVRKPIVTNAINADIRTRIEKNIMDSCSEAENRAAAEAAAKKPAAELLAELNAMSEEQRNGRAGLAIWQGLQIQAAKDGPAAAAALLPLVADKSHESRASELVRALGKTRDASVRPALNDYLIYSPSAAVRAEAARALGAQLPEREAIKMLRDALASEWDGQVQQAIRGALEAGSRD